MRFFEQKKLKISVKDFWPNGGGGPEKRNIFQKKKGYYLLGDGHIVIMEILDSYSVLLVINIRNVMFTNSSGITQ